MTLFEKVKSQGYYFIAEAGVNYYEIAEIRGISVLNAAKLMIKEAAKAGADAVKFQAYKAETLTRIDSPGAWDKKDVTVDTMYELFKLYDHFGEEEYAALALYAKEMGIDFLATPFDNESIDFLDKYMDVYKISSSDISNFPLIKRISEKKKPIIMSVGGAEIEEIDEAIAEIRKHNKELLCLLHCVIEYPTPYEDINLKKISSLKNRYPDLIIGFSDHTRPDKNMEVLKTAFALGAEIIEKHYTLDKSIKGKNDHYHAMDPDDIRAAKEGFEFIKKLLGNGDIRCLETEVYTRNSIRRSAVSNRYIKAGDILTEKDVIFKRPGDGLSPKETSMLYGKTAIKDIELDKVIRLEDFR